MQIFKSFQKNPKEKTPISGKLGKKCPNGKCQFLKTPKKVKKNAQKKKNTSWTTIDVVLKNIDHETMFSTLDIAK